MSERAEQLYTTRILRLAASIPHHARLEAPQASVRKVSPICGSRVTVDLDMADGRVSRFGQEVRACALGQAAAAIVGGQVIGRTPGELAAARDALKAFLKGSAAAPAGVWADLALFEPAIPHRSRHGSIVLALEAATEAAETAARQAAGA
jgi:NifU-like protein involved in Fe-S cluster formation